MTKSTITRERLEELAAGQSGFNLRIATHEESQELARMVLAAMDSEPVKRVNADQMHHVCLEANRHLDKYGAMAKEVNKLLGRIPAQPAPVVPEEATPDSIEILASARRRDHAVFQWDEDQRNAAADSWNACRAAMLQASPVCTCPSGDGSLRWPCPVHPGSSPENPGCWCRTCRPVDINDMRFVVCPDCGNKRCPRANDHRNACTGSNEPGQEGSAYPADPQEVPDGK
ncbi:Uncharacterised protein [Klebsiella quasipneumoniae]|uniref:DUF551 domain-containing protein n=1 Tax=Klebsiella TaxID=570 RepID=UPI0009C47695|nr:MULTISPECIES: DUF551 domain-containing protein [Klebsiella]SLR06805.1 Uncharacterised protein [Klebsiella quasipneumoniae]VUT04440.1 hypothetical protein SB6415_02109 [Klebsiella pasteurii]